MNSKPAELNSLNTEIDFNIHLTPGSIKGAMKEANAPSRDLWQVPIENLRIIENFNVRTPGAKHDAAVEEFASSMLSEGYYQDKPLAGYVAKENDSQVIYIYDGHTRLEAAKLANTRGANIERIPVVVSQQGISIEDLTIALVRANSGKPLTPYETGVVCKRLVRFGLELGDIAYRLGITPQYVGNLLALMSAPIELRKMVIDERVSASTAIDMITQHGEGALNVLEKAQERANASGNSRVTAKHVDPASEFKKAVKAEAETMFHILNDLSSHEGFSGLPSDFQQRIAATLSNSADLLT